MTIHLMELRTMSLQCPRYLSPKIASLRTAMKITAAVGAVGGVARGISTAIAGGQVGASVAAVAGPIGISSAQPLEPFSADSLEAWAATPSVLGEMQ